MIKRTQNIAEIKLKLLLNKLVDKKVITEKESSDIKKNKKTSTNK